MKILGISAFYHDSAATIIEDGNILAAAQEERFTRKKHDSSFPVQAIKFCLESTGIRLDELDAIAFYDKPLLKFERLLETYYAFAPRGIRSFLMAMPIWLKEKLFLKKVIYDELNSIDSFEKKKVKLLFPEHHLSHSASAFYPSPFDDAAIITVDGVGEWTTASICHGKGNTIKVLKEYKFPHSLGLLYSAFTYYLGFRVNSGEYKMMGLAPYGNPHSSRIQELETIIKDHLVDIKEDGSIWLNQRYFNYSSGLKMVHENKWATLFGVSKRKSESEITQEHCDLAMAIQNITEDIVLKMALEAKRLTGSENLCMAGGVALNCVANGKLADAELFKGLFIQPAAGDAGGSLGAALAGHYIYFEKERELTKKMDTMQGSYLGPEFSEKDIESMIRKNQASFKKYDAFSELASDIASVIDKGNVVGWMQGRMEFGPRALGNRSILGDPRNTEMQKKMNLKIKYRESFRPFAPSVIAEDYNDFFEKGPYSPYMLLVDHVKPKRRKELPANYQQLPLDEKLYQLRSDIPAVTHVDFSARIQTVHQETNPKYWSLINEFKKITGYGCLINTSFNIRGEPIVCTPDDAFRCFMATEMDFLVIGNYLFKKEEQEQNQDSSAPLMNEYPMD